MAQLVGAAAALVLVRRQRAAKLVFNLAQLALTTSVAVIVFRAVAGQGDPFGVAGWIGAMLGAVAASLVGILLVTVAIAIAEGSLEPAEASARGGISIVSTIGVSNVVLIAIELARADRRALVLLVLPAAIGGRSDPRLREPGEAPRASRVPLRVDEGDAGSARVQPRGRPAARRGPAARPRRVRGDLPVPGGTQQGLRSTLGAQGEMNAHADIVSPADAQVLAALEAGPRRDPALRVAARRTRSTATSPHAGCRTGSSLRSAARTASSA